VDRWKRAERPPSSQRVTHRVPSTSTAARPSTCQVLVSRHHASGQSWRTSRKIAVPHPANAASAIGSMPTMRVFCSCDSASMCGANRLA
jgi:hypothetical protein